MDFDFMIYYLLEYSIALGLSMILVLMYVLIQVVRYAKASDFSVYIQSLSADEMRNKCVGYVVDKINVTNSLVDKRVAVEDVVAKCIYNHDAVKQLGKDLEELFGMQYRLLVDKYPALSSLDLLVLSLLSIEMSNAEICSVLRMEKRTLYRRRQLIAQRISIPSTELESFASANLN